MLLTLWRDGHCGWGTVPSCLDLGPSDLSSLFVEIHNFILKFTWKFKGTRRAKTVVRKPGLCTRWSGAQQLGGHCSTGVGVRGQAEHRNRHVLATCSCVQFQQCKRVSQGKAGPWEGGAPGRDEPLGWPRSLSGGAGLASVHMSDDTFTGALLRRRQDSVHTCSVGLAEPRPHHTS